MVERSSSGSPWALINVHKGMDRGLNVAFINSVREIPDGANLGFVNITQGRASVDIGGLSVSEHADVQVGFVNVTRDLEGVQIGFINFAENGFLPVFPFFNMPKR